MNDDNHDLSDSSHCFTSDVISLKRLTRARKVRSMRVSLSETAVDGYYVLECGSDSWKIPADDVRRIELQLMSVMLAKLQKLPDAEIDAKYQLVKSMIRDVLRAVAKNKPLSEKLFIPVRKETFMLIGIEIIFGIIVLIITGLGTWNNEIMR